MVGPKPTFGPTFGLLELFGDFPQVSWLGNFHRRVADLHVAAMRDVAMLVTRSAREGLT